MEMEGLVVSHDGLKNTLMYHGIHEYPIGGMIAEYARLHPTIIKEVIMSYSDLNVEPTTDNISVFFPWFINELETKVNLVSAIVITFEFMESVVGLVKMTKDERDSLFKDKTKEKGKIYEFIFEHTNYNKPGIETMEQLLLTCYLFYADIYVAFKYSFEMLATGDEYEKKQVDYYCSMYADNIEFQHIDFKIACFEGEFKSIYTIKSSISLLLFEAAHCLDRDTKFVKCANCGEYFVPEGRKDTIYCHYISPQNSKKTCKDIGAQITRSNKEKNDVCTKEYRKVYMRYKMKALRHPEDWNNKNTFEKLQTEVKIWRKQLSNGVKTTEQFLNWLKSY